MNLRGNSASLISQIGSMMRPKIQQGRSINFDQIIQNYQKGQNWAQKQKLIKQKQRAYEENRRNELANALEAVSYKDMIKNMNIENL